MESPQSTLSILKQVMKAITPHGIVEFRRKRLFPTGLPAVGFDRDRFHEARRLAIETAYSRDPEGIPKISGLIRDDIVGFLLNRGIPLHHILEGSVPAPSLDFLGQHLQKLSDLPQPLIAVHIGNFVGVSLSFLSATLKQLHPSSLVVAIDPNLAHRGVVNPQEHVAALLCACGLQRNTLLVAGYSGAKNISNDGVAFGDYNPVNAYAQESACELTIQNLNRFMAGKCHVAMMDGNHEASYLLSEVKDILPLMRPGGLLIFDDVDSSWPEIKQVFDEIHQLGLKPIATDGRIGIAKLIQEPAAL